MPGEERRRSQRVIIRIPVTLELTKSGQVIKIPAHTVAVNVHGAMVLCSALQLGSRAHHATVPRVS